MLALGRVPPGLYHDEAYNGLDALQVLAGQWQIYFAANHGREPLFIYLTTLPISILGRSPAALRLAAAVVGTLTIPVTVGLTRSWFGQRVGLLSGAILAITLWHVHISRVAFRAVTLPLAVALTLWAGTRAWQTNKSGSWLLAGLLYGVSFYSYLPARATPLAFAALAVVVVLRRQGRRLWPGVAWFAIGTTVVLVPLVAYAISNWETVMGRPGTVSILNPLINKGDLAGTALDHLWRTIGMFFFQGDTIPRHNLPGRPVYDPALGLMMLVGTVWTLVRARHRLAPALLLIWVGVMLIPTWAAEDAPHFLRAVGVLPLAPILPALGLEQVLRWLEGRNLKWLGAACTLLILALGLGSTTVDYFVHYPEIPETSFFFEEAATTLAADVNHFLGSGWQGEGWIDSTQETDPEHRIYVEQRLWDEWAAVPFLIPAQEVISTQLEEYQPVDKTSLMILWPYGDNRDRLEALPSPARIRVWEGPLAKGDLDPIPFASYVAFATAPVAEMDPGAGTLFDNGITLTESTIDPQENAWEIELVWVVEHPLNVDYTVFVHLYDGTTPVAQADGDPAGGYYPTSAWRVGDQIVDSHTLEIPPEWQGEPSLNVGLYLRSTLERVSVVGEGGEPAGDHVSLPVPPTTERGNSQ